VAQEGGGNWGLFGILGEAVVPLKAENVTGQVAEPSSGGGGGAGAAAGLWSPVRWLGFGAAMLAMTWTA
jgi:hypothetical protein